MTGTYTEMLHGDLLWRKRQATAMWMNRMGKTEMVLLDAEAGVSYMTASHYEAHDYLVRVLKGGRGFGRALEGKRKILAAVDVKRRIDAANPARAAEQRVGGMKAERSIAAEMKRFRDWKNLNWGFYYGRGELWKA